VNVSAARPSAGSKVAVIGLGLVGGSLARALTAAGYRVLGVDRPKVCRAARAAGAVAETASAVERAVASDILVLAAPPAANRRLLHRLAKVARPDLVVTDVGSVKGPIVREAARLRLSSFVGGHAMAGTERRGFAASSAGLFEGAVWWLVPAADPRATRAVRTLVRAVGARPMTIDAARHDRVVAFLSHAPQIASWALHEAARADPVVRRYLSGAGPGFRDMTRLARSPEGLWREILQENRAEVTRALDVVARRLAARAPTATGSKKRRRPPSPSGRKR
jgi:prephenate dehydrogenase